jgi:hypothetical protein
VENSRHNPGNGDPLPIGPHERFLELCAIATSGELSQEEQRELHAHLAACSDCRQAMQEFDAAAGVGMPLLMDHLEARDSIHAESMPVYATERPDESGNRHDPLQGSTGLDFLHRNGRGRLQVNWNYVWMPFAAAVVLMVALGIYSFQLGKHRGQEVAQVRPATSEVTLDALEQQISDSGHEREVLKAQLADRDRMISGLRGRIEDQSAALNAGKSALANLELSLQHEESDKQQAAQQNSALSEQYAAVQASLDQAQTQLDSLEQQRQRDQLRAVSLEAQIRDLHGQLHDQEQALDKQQELLAHDRDIRELMGARDLYIAEVYDVARDGKTQKPYGRVFYTKGRSLIFYAYDLDQQAGLRKASTFQAWGSRGSDRQQALNLGVFYEDNVDKKRWVLKFDDPEKLEQIDAVFVTVEPHGGSHKPSGRPLLFAYLKVNPNHP